MYNRQLHNKTYYEKNKENIKRKQREKRQKMKEALQQLEGENQETETPKPEPMISKFFLNISDNVKSMLFKAAISGSLVASQAVYRALKKTIENRQSDTPSAPVVSSNPLD